jgi:hypothetical protein
VQDGEDGNGGDNEEEGLEDSQEKAVVQNFDPHAGELIPITPPFETCGLVAHSLLGFICAIGHLSLSLSLYS